MKNLINVTAITETKFNLKGIKDWNRDIIITRLE